MIRYLFSFIFWRLGVEDVAKADGVVWLGTMGSHLQDWFRKHKHKSAASGWSDKTGLYWSIARTVRNSASVSQECYFIRTKPHGGISQKPLTNFYLVHSRSCLSLRTILVYSYTTIYMSIESSPPRNLLYCPMYFFFLTGPYTWPLY